MFGDAKRAALDKTNPPQQSQTQSASVGKPNISFESPSDTPKKSEQPTHQTSLTFNQMLTSFKQLNQQATTGTDSKQPTQQTTTSFGQPSQNTTASFGQPSQQTTTSIGRPSKQTTTPFEQPSQQTTTSFGQPSQQTTTSFGQPSQKTTTPFGQTTSPFGQTPSPFSKISGADSCSDKAQFNFGTFGSPSNCFTGVGSGGTNLSFDQSSTAFVPFRPISDHDSALGLTFYFQVITAMPEYNNRSFEELRLEDYRRNLTSRDATFKPITLTPFLNPFAQHPSFSGFSQFNQSPSPSSNSPTTWNTTVSRYDGTSNEVKPLSFGPRSQLLQTQDEQQQQKQNDKIGGVVFPSIRQHDSFIDTPIHQGTKSSSRTISSVNIHQLRLTSGIDKATNTKCSLQSSYSNIEKETQDHASPTNSYVAIKEGYYCSPTLDMLKRLTFDELKKVDNFTVGRHGCGKVQFDQPVNLAHVPLDKILASIVFLDHKTVTIYPDIKFKPAKGTDLNIPATVTLERCYSIDKVTKLPIMDPSHPKFALFLEKLKSRPGTIFVDYDIAAGSWKFKIGSS